MRLLHTEKLIFENKADRIDHYSILSHVWEKNEHGETNEVLYEDMLGDQSFARRKRGWTKLLGACQQARHDGFEYIWIDTCCIDKGSSSELSEAINSMYTWYEKATLCYAYLYDVPGGAEIASNPAFRGSEWFGRGWTLQELIAPTRVIFYAPGRDGWWRLGEKATSPRILSEITGIRSDVLSGIRPPTSVSIAQRMSWASKRKTTRPEDLSYCLMGLFNVNMPMIYGGDEEGDKTFLRLQEEIMKDSDDESLFGWRDNTASDTSTTGLLATHPRLFEDSAHYFSYQDWEPRTPFSKTNRGLRISLPLRLVEKDLYLAALNCPMPGKTYGFLGIYLKRLTSFDDAKFENQYARMKVGELVGIDNAERRGQIQTLYVRQTTNASGHATIFPEHVVQLRRFTASNTGYELFGSMGEDSSSRLPIQVGSNIPGGLPTAFRIAKAENQLAGVFVFERGFQNRFAVFVGSYTASGDLGVGLLEHYDSQTFRNLEPYYIPCQPGVRHGHGSGTCARQFSNEDRLGDQVLYC